MRCVDHPEREAVGLCNHCARQVCSDCRLHLHEETYCRECASLKSGGAQRVMHSPAVAGILSFVIAGMGQVYNAQYGKAVAIFLTSWLIIPWVVGIYDAHHTAQRIASGEVIPEKRTGCLIATLIGIMTVLGGFAVAIFIAVAAMSEAA